MHWYQVSAELLAAHSDLFPKSPVVLASIISNSSFLAPQALNPSITLTPLPLTPQPIHQQILVCLQNPLRTSHLSTSTTPSLSQAFREYRWTIASLLLVSLPLFCFYPLSQSESVKAQVSEATLSHNLQGLPSHLEWELESLSRPTRPYSICLRYEDTPIYWNHHLQEPK